MKWNQYRNMFVIVIFFLFINVSILSVSSEISSHGIPNHITQKGNIDNDLFDVQMRSLMFTSHIPSLTACIIKDGSLVWSKGYGYYDFSGLKQPSTDTIYQVASISKTITATAILQLYDQGLFLLDDDVNTYLPFSLRNPSYPDIPITFRHLLSHHASLHDHDEDAAYQYFAGDYPYSYVEELLVPGGESYHKEFWGQYPPGSGGNYSNIGFVILGYLVEIISGQNLEMYCKQHIFQPLQMDSTSFSMDGLDTSKMACSYIRVGRIYVKTPLIDYTFLDPCGGLLTTLEDLSHFLIAHMNNGYYEGCQLLKQETIQLVHMVQYPESAPYYGILRFGLGWLIFEEESGVFSQGHDGDLSFYHARMRLFDDNTSGIIYLFNRAVQPFFYRYIPSQVEYFSDVRIRQLLYEKADHMMLL